MAARLDPARWIDHYLPHWTTPQRSRARYALTGEGLQLRIGAEQLDWRPEDAPLRVSNLQTAGGGGGPGRGRAGAHLVGEVGRGRCRHRLRAVRRVLVCAEADYPLQLMVDLFELGPGSESSQYRKTATVHRVRGT